MKPKKSEYLTVRCTPEVKEYIEKRSKEEDRTISWIINKIISDYIAEQKKGTVHFTIQHNENINL